MFVQIVIDLSLFLYVQYVTKLLFLYFNIRWLPDLKTPLMVTSQLFLHGWGYILSLYQRRHKLCRKA